MTSAAAARRTHAQELRAAQQAAAARRHRTGSLVAWAGALTVVAVVVVIAMLSARPQQAAATGVAPAFSLQNTAGAKVSLADYRGRNVILYFSEGAGCQACLIQMAAIEADKAAFDKANFVVLPIVMNSKSQIMADMAANNVTTPFLLDDGTVSSAYRVLGKGMHAGLPGHSFVVIDSSGTERWYGNYPSMWLEPTQLLAQAQQAIAG